MKIGVWFKTSKAHAERKNFRLLYRSQRVRGAEDDQERHGGELWGRETEDGFCHLDGGCHCCGKQSRMEETNQWPYSPRGELGTNDVSVADVFSTYQCAVVFVFGQADNMHAYA